MADLPLIDLIMARIARDDGVTLVALNEQAEWRAEYRALADYFLNDRDPGCTFTGEDLRLDMVRLYSMPAPHHPNAWGAMARAVLREWLKAGLIVQDGLRNARAVSSHARLYPLYRVT